MAFPVFRRKTKKVYVYYTDPKNNHKLVQLPREQTEHLDGKPADEVYAWVEKFEAEHGIARNRAIRKILQEDDPLAVLWRKYQKNRSNTRKRRANTAKTETEIFEKDIVGFFVGKHGKKDPTLWHDLVPDFHDHLSDLGYADRTIQKTLWTLERFGKYLVFNRYMTFPFVVQVPARENHKFAVLKTEKGPEEILKFVDKFECAYDIDFKLAILLGYFAALRPSELWALDKSDLLTGSNSELAKTAKGLQDYKLGSRLSVNVSKTLGDGKGAKPEEITKNEGSTDIVHIWHKEAAKKIAELARDKPNGRLFPFSYGWLERAWREHVKPTLELTPHDLRRASAVYLGRTKRIDLSLLQEHLRHSEIATTMLYTRRPKETPKKHKLKQDFDDVA